MNHPRAFNQGRNGVRLKRGGRHCGKGRVQLAAVRALALAGRRGVATSTDVVRIAYARELAFKRRAIERQWWRYARLALARIAEPVGRGDPPGRPILWRAKP
jgi:voltage-gated potassium channel Kch